MTHSMRKIRKYAKKLLSYVQAFKAPLGVFFASHVRKQEGNDNVTYEKCREKIEICSRKEAV